MCECRESTEIVSQGSTGARLPFAVDGGTFELDANTLPGMSIDWNGAVELLTAPAVEWPPPPPPPG